jgi:hypothetical protein
VIEGRVSAVEYARMKKVSAMAVSKWIEGGKLGPLGDAVIKKGRRYMIDPLKADGYLDINVRMTNQRLFPGDDTSLSGDPDENTQGAAGTEKAAGSKPDSYRQATTWKIRYEALLRQQEYEIKSGKYILADEAHATFFNKARSFRDAILNIPPRIGRIVAAEIYDAVSSELRSIIDEIPDTVLPRVQELVIARTELIMKSEIELALKELSD